MRSLARALALTATVATAVLLPALSASAVGERVTLASQCPSGTVAVVANSSDPQPWVCDDPTGFPTSSFPDGIVASVQDCYGLSLDARVKSWVWYGTFGSGSQAYILPWCYADTTVAEQTPWDYEVTAASQLPQLYDGTAAASFDPSVLRSPDPANHTAAESETVYAAPTPSPTSLATTGPAATSAADAALRTGDASTIADPGYLTETGATLLGGLLSGACLVRAWEFAKRLVAG
jgi:hypothetical protein